MDDRGTPSAHGRPWSPRVLLALLLALPALGQPGPEPRPHLLVADTGNHRILELDGAGALVWRFGDGSCRPGPRSVAGPVDALRVDAAIFLCGAGVPPGASPQCPGGCVDNRVLAISRDGEIFWQYGVGGATGSGPGLLNVPVCARFTAERHVLITDQGNHRVIEVDFRTRQILRQWGVPGHPGAGPGRLATPASAELLGNGNLLVADAGNDRVVELDGLGQVRWQYGQPGAWHLLHGPGSACRLPSGTTLIADSGNDRVLEVDGQGRVVFQYDSARRPGSVPRPRPARAVRLRSGNTLVSDRYNHQVIEIDPFGEVVFSHGELGQAGAGAHGLNAPGDAKALGDFTGLTLPY